MKDFIKSVFANLLALAIVGGALLFFFILMISASLMSGNQQVMIPSKSVLVLDMGMPITDKPPKEDFSQFIAQINGDVPPTMSLRQVLDTIDYAAKDSRIKGLYLTGYAVAPGYASGWAAYKEVREALLRFKESGKPIIAYNLAYTEKSYYLASLADRIYMNPMGMIENNGFASQVMFLKEAFEKYGIDVQVTRVGKYKSAVEPYMRDDMSEANREQNLLLLNDLYDQFALAVNESRGLSVEEINRSASEEAVIQGEAALSAGWVDGLVHFDEILEEFRKLTETRADARHHNNIHLFDYYKDVQFSIDHGSGPKIAIVYVEGTIIDGDSEDQAGGDHVASLLRRARLDDDVKAVVLRVNSPGGSATAAEVMSREADLIQEAGKPVIVSMGTVAASGGYWIAAKADKIYAQPNTITGSIGVFGTLFNFKNLMNDHGVHVDTAKTDEMADLTSIFRPKTEEELSLIQGFVDQIYDQFLDKVAQGRNLERERVMEIAQGRVWSGTQALEIGLVDEMGGLHDAIKAAAEAASMGDRYAVTQYQRTKEFAEELLEAMGMAPPEPVTGRMGIVDQTLSTIKTNLDTLNHYNDPLGVYVRLPYDLHVD